MFLVFVAVNFIIILAPFGTPFKVGLGIVGILLPSIWALRSPARIFPDLSRAAREEFLPDPSWTLWAVLFLAALAVRFYRIGDLSLWPNLDESLLGAGAVYLTEKWDWKFFYTTGQVPPLPIWAASGLMALGLPPMTSIWAPSAAASFLAVLAGYFAARQFLSRSLSLACMLLMAFSFWPMLTGRLCHQGILLPLWVCGCLWALGRWMKARGERERRDRVFLLGLAAGLGTLTFTPWPAVALALALAVFWGQGLRLRNLDLALPFFGGAALSALPFLIAVVAEGYGSHIWSVSPVSGWFDWERQMASSAGYLTTLFWGLGPDDVVYQAPWGGMLNPILSAAFFLGALLLVSDRRHPALRWSVTAFVLFLLPGLLSMNIEMFRVAQAIPFLAAGTALGLFGLLAALRPARRILAGSLLLGLIFAMDFHSIVHYRQEGPGKSGKIGIPIHEASYRAYQVLRDLSARSGPGLVFTEFAAVPFDQSLFLTTYPFNAVENPKVALREVRWAAVVVNGGYASFLEARFEGWQGRWLPTWENPVEHWMLGLIPLTKGNLVVLKDWARAHGYFRELSRAVNEAANQKGRVAARDLFRERPAFLELDPFLASCYWEKMSEFLYYQGFETNYEEHVRALTEALRRGVPASHLSFKLGSLLLRGGRLSEAREVLAEGLRREPGNAELSAAWNLLRRLEKEKPEKSPGRIPERGGSAL